MNKLNFLLTIILSVFVIHLYSQKTGTSVRQNSNTALFTSGEKTVRAPVNPEVNPLRIPHKKETISRGRSYSDAYLLEYREYKAGAALVPLRARNNITYDSRRWTRTAPSAITGHRIHPLNFSGKSFNRMLRPVMLPIRVKSIKILFPSQLQYVIFGTGFKPSKYYGFSINSSNPRIIQKSVNRLSLSEPVHPVFSNGCYKTGIIIRNETPHFPSANLTVFSDNRGRVTNIIQIDYNSIIIRDMFNK